ncbi:unnamed protein product [Mytilus coruscus]|uniref:Integrase catalytic domain-containing protein n=1 Tax=Mytilus coruscus TaxID=42192 RepID=A0A6J8DFU2_MYTCO|nr:unnamed protein product [Mytilus coruscus]
MQIWVSVYGALEVGVYTDNGEEFNSQIFRENLNMSVKTTAGYSRWETAISWVVNAKNSLVNVYGYSPYQIVFGRNPNLPSTLVNKPPALEGETMSKTTGKHLDNVVVFIRYGGTYLRVHECRILRDFDGQNAKKNKSQEKRVTLNESLKTQNFVKNKAEHEVLYHDSDEEEDSHVNNQSDNEIDNGAEKGHESELESQVGDSELHSDNPVNNQGHESGEGSQSGGDSELENDNPANQRHGITQDHEDRYIVLQ